MISLALVSVMGGVFIIVHPILGYCSSLHTWMRNRTGQLHASFLMFFVYLPLIVFVFFALLAFPLGLVLERYASSGLATDYRRWALDMGSGVALVVWLRDVIKT